MQPFYQDESVTLYHARCEDVLPMLVTESIDAVITDPPYGTTACAWDTPIAFDFMWSELKRVTKRNAAIVLFGSQPFTSALVMSNPGMFRYEWIWNTVCITGFLDVHRRPMKKHQNILVFSERQSTYNPIRSGKATRSFGKMSEGVNKRHAYAGEFGSDYQQGVGYPQSIIEFQRPTNVTDKDYGLHPTQKPLALLEYLILTYTNPGDVVLDFTAGSGTTAVAAKKLGRTCIAIEQELEYCQTAVTRLYQSVMQFEAL